MLLIIPSLVRRVRLSTVFSTTFLAFTIDRTDVIAIAALQHHPVLREHARHTELSDLSAKIAPRTHTDLATSAAFGGLEPDRSSCHRRQRRHDFFVLLLQCYGSSATARAGA